MNQLTTKLFAQLDINARESYTAIGKKLRKSQQWVSYNINRHQKEGAIKHFYPLVDYAKLGYLCFRVYFQVSYTKETTFEKVLEALIKDEHTGIVMTTGSPFDIMCTFYFSNPSAFYKHLRKLMTTFDRQLKNYVVLTTVVSRHFGRKYLLSNYPVKEYFIGGDRKITAIDKKDQEILHLLNQNASQSSLAMGQKTSMSAKTVINHMKDLEQKNIILAYKTLFDLSLYNIVPWLYMIKFHNVSVDLEQKFINFLKGHAHCISVTKTLGEWDVEILLEANDLHQLRKIERELREGFAPMIQQIQGIPIFQTYKLVYCPLNLGKTSPFTL